MYFILLTCWVIENVYCYTVGQELDSLELHTLDPSDATLANSQTQISNGTTVHQSIKCQNNFSNNDTTIASNSFVDIHDNMKNSLYDNLMEEYARTAFKMKIMYSCVGLTGMFVNFIVIFVISKTKTMRQSLANCFILNQSILDFACSFSLILSAYFNRSE